MVIYSRPGSDTALHYLVVLPSQEGCVSDGCKAKRVSDKDLGRAVQQPVSGKEILPVVYLPPLLGAPHLWPCFVLMQAVVLFAA